MGTAQNVSVTTTAAPANVRIAPDKKAVIAATASSLNMEDVECQEQVFSIATWIKNEVLKGAPDMVANYYTKAFVDAGFFSPSIIADYLSTDLLEGQDGPLKVIRGMHKRCFLDYVKMKRDEPDC